MTERYPVDRVVAPNGVMLPEGDYILKNVHSKAACVGRQCVIHNPSPHHMRTWDLTWRADTRVMERTCPEHGVGHPDPDDLYYHELQGETWQAVHGCCGCCIPPEEEEV